MDGRLWLPRDPLLSAPARPAVGWLLAGSAVLTAVGGMLVAHRSQGAWVDRSADFRIQAALAGHHGLLIAAANLVKPVYATALVAAVALACVVARRLNGALLAVAGVPAAVGLTEGLKHVIGRTLDGALVYPSGHTTGAFALAAVVTILMLSPWRHVLPLVIRLAMAIASVLTACAVALAVIGLYWHYFSDTLAGAAVGVDTVLAVALLLDSLIRRIPTQQSTPTAAPAKAADAQLPADTDPDWAHRAG